MVHRRKRRRVGNGIELGFCLVRQAVIDSSPGSIDDGNERQGKQWPGGAGFVAPETSKVLDKIGHGSPTRKARS
jgi:hypothetical protein